MLTILYDKNKRLYFILGLTIILQLFLYRLFVIRLPKDITEVYTDICLLILLCYSIQLISIIYIGIKAKFFRMRSPNKYFVKINDNLLNPLNTYYYISLQTVDNYIKHTLLGPNLLGTNLKYFCEFMIKYFGVKHSTYKWIFFILDIIPKGFLLLVFSIDILLNKQFCYIYKVAWLVLIPIMFRYITFTLREFSEWNINILNTKFIIVKSVKYGYILDTTAIIRECCFTYYADIYDKQPETILNRTEAIPINIGHEYIFRDELIKVFNGSQEATEAYFDRILKGFDFMRKVRELIYKLDHCPFHWKYLYFNAFRYIMYLFIWLNIYLNLSNNLFFNIEWLITIQNIQEPFSQLDIFYGYDKP